jgi:hypothetical protein
MTSACPQDLPPGRREGVRRDRRPLDLTGGGHLDVASHRFLAIDRPTSALRLKECGGTIWRSARRGSVDLARAPGSDGHRMLELRLGATRRHAGRAVDRRTTHNGLRRFTDPWALERHRRLPGVTVVS